MESDLSEILQLWSELHVMPDVAINAGHVSVHDERPEESQFHMSILQYTQQMPTLELDGEFRGQFEPIRTAEESTMDATPSRVQGTPTLAADTSAVPELLQPTDAVMAKSIKLRESLEREKTERESSIQSYYDELCELWMRFDVPETEMDAFVLDHRGSTLQVVEAYRTELDKMRALKSQHMALFISKTREQIWEQWDALYMSEAERRNTFPAYFLALPGEDRPSRPHSIGTNCWPNMKACMPNWPRCSNSVHRFSASSGATMRYAMRPVPSKKVRKTARGC